MRPFYERVEELIGFRVFHKANSRDMCSLQSAESLDGALFLGGGVHGVQHLQVGHVAVLKVLIAGGSPLPLAQIQAGAVVVVVGEILIFRMASSSSSPFLSPLSLYSMVDGDDDDDDNKVMEVNL